MKRSCFLLLLIMWTSCSRFVDEQNVPNYLVGSWEWVATYGGWGGIYTPETEGYTMSLTVTESNVIWKKNGEELEFYYVEVEKSEDTEYVFFNNGKEPEGVDLCNSKLHVSVNDNKLYLSSALCADTDSFNFELAE